MKTISLLIAVIAAVLALRTLIRFRADKSSWTGTLIWLGLWTALAVFAIHPGLLDYFMVLARMKNRMFFLFVVSITMLFGLAYHLFESQRKTDRTLARLTQEIAILNNLVSDRKETRKDGDHGE